MHAHKQSCTKGWVCGLGRDSSCACACSVCRACSELATRMTQGGSGLSANYKLIESGGGFDDHVECSKRTATSRLLGSMFSVRFPWLDCWDHIDLSVHGAYACVLCPVVRVCSCASSCSWGVLPCLEREHILVTQHVLSLSLSYLADGISPPVVKCLFITSVMKTLIGMSEI